MTGALKRLTGFDLIVKARVSGSESERRAPIDSPVFVRVTFHTLPALPRRGLSYEDVVDQKH